MDDETGIDDNEFVLNHVILPRFLKPEKPKYAQQLQLMDRMVQNVEKLAKFIPDKTVDLMQRFKRIHISSPDDDFKAEITRQIRQLQHGTIDTFAMFVRKQNCTFMIHMLSNENANNRRPVFVLATFPGDLPSREIYKHDSDIEFNYPAQVIKVNSSKMMQSDHFINQLCFLFEKSPYESNGRNYVSEWLVTLLADENSSLASPDEFHCITKKYRCELHGDSKQVYFRRARVYMTMKVILQHSLSMELGVDAGKWLYKAIMLKFLCRVCAAYRRCNIELLSQMSAKLARRIEKFSQMHQKRMKPEIMELINDGIKEAKTTIQTIREKINLKIQVLQRKDEKNAELAPLDDMNFEADICQQMTQLKQYIDQGNITISETDINSRYEVKSFWRFFNGAWPEIEVVPKITDEIERRIFWLEFENQILYRSGLVDESAGNIWSWFQQYSKYADEKYAEIPFLISRKMLVYLKLIQILDQQIVEQFPLMKEHRSGINPKIIESLVLPHRNDMEIAYLLEQYFGDRNNNAKDPGLTEERNASENSFSVKYARDDWEMIIIHDEIQDMHDENVRKKEEEWLHGKQIVVDLREDARQLPLCPTLNGRKQCDTNVCQRCKKLAHAANCKIAVYEHLLPIEEYNKLAIIFELRIPFAIASLRDMLFSFAKICSGISEHVDIKFNWTDCPQMSIHNKSNHPIVKVGSMTPRISKMLHVDEPLEAFIIQNVSNCVFHANRKAIPMPITDDAIKNVCTFKTDDEYADLYSALADTNHTENEILTKLQKCPRNLNQTEYKHFGLLRADGHRLQLRKLHAMIIHESLSFEKESVLSLVMQTLWECGISGDAEFTRESHIDFKNDEFCRAMIQQLTEYTRQQVNNWMHPFKLLMVTLTAVRVFEINEYQLIPSEIGELLNGIRAIVMDWIANIEKAIHQTNNMNENVERDLRLKLIYVAIIGCMTFFVHYEHKHHELIFDDDSNEAVCKLWLHFQITLKNSVQMYTNNEDQLPSNLRMFMRIIELIGIYVEPKMKDSINSNRNQINLLIATQWPLANDGKMTDIYPHPMFSHIMVSELELVDDSKTITIDVITGQFLVNGLSLCRLSGDVVNSVAYKRFFGDVAFEVQPVAENCFRTSHNFNGCIYEFKTSRNNIIIIERNDNGLEKELIPHEQLDGDFPYLLVQNYTHWWNKQTNCIEFRQRMFDKTHFFNETEVEYQLDLADYHLSHIKTQRKLLNINSHNYKQIVDRLSRLEHKYYIHVHLERVKVVTVELIRMKLRFTLDCSDGTSDKFYLKSNEFSGMQISCTQKIGTLYGLNHGLVLESCSHESSAKKQILLMPNGKIRSKLNKAIDFHALVDIETKEIVRNPPFYEYQVDNVCQQLRASNSSHASWFFLAYLHALTSYGQIESFIGMSGTERALQILQSAFSWSSSPYEPEALEILKEIGKLSPIRKMNQYIQSVNWPKDIPHHVAQDSFIFIIKKLIADSQRLHGLYDGENSKGDFKSKSDTKLWLNERDYNRCLALNPNLRVSNEFIKNTVQRTSLFTLNSKSKSLKTTRTISLLYHNNEFQVPNTFNLSKFLTHNRKKLIGLGEMDDHEFSKLLYHNESRDDLANLWMDLYEAARKQTCTREQFALIFSLLVHQGEPIEPILVLQAVAQNAQHFKNVKPPAVDQFNLNQGVYGPDKSDQKLVNILKSFRRQASDALLTTIVDDLQAEIVRLWPCNSVDFSQKCQFPHMKSNLIRDQVYNFKGAENAINKLLSDWKKNRKLNAFIKKFHLHLKSLPASVKPMKLPEYDLFVTPKPKNWPKFEINTDQKILEHLSSFQKQIKEAEHVWHMKTRNVQRTSNDFRTTIENIMNSENTRHLIAAALFPRIVPSSILPKLIVTGTDSRLKAMIGAWAIQIVQEQRNKRIEIYSQKPELKYELDRELENEPHENWKPCERPEWLIFEIEQNLTIRRIQIEVAHRMIEPPMKDGVDTKHCVMQLNMGEGKTAVIVPILAAVLADGDQACQITVLKSLFARNLKSLRQYLGGMLNQKVYTFPCRRDMAIARHLNDMQTIYEECQKQKGVILTLPEYRLSFHLKSYESIQMGDFKAANRFLSIQNWMNENVRNILDESDAILQANYQLIYTVGNQLPPDGGEQRWNVIQSVLNRIPFHMRRLFKKYGEDKIEFDHDYVKNGHVFGDPNVKYRSDVFTPCRILDEHVFDDLRSALIQDFFESKLNIEFPDVTESMKNDLQKVFSLKNLDKKDFEIVNNFSTRDQNKIMILSGLLRFEVLKMVLSKRWRVNYGVDPNGQRKMAIPFKAKDVPTEMTEFGHSDVAICFTQLSYYYSGLTDAELRQLFATLEHRQNAAAIYERWIFTISWKILDHSIVSYSGVNLDDPNQRNILFNLLRSNMFVIDFWLSTQVYPHEAKVFQQKLMCTAWDLCSEQLKHCVTGFSGTNDTKHILPLPIAQNDLPELESTNAKMRQILLKLSEDSYIHSPALMTGGSIIKNLVKRKIRVLLDSGALMMELSNEQVAIEWLKLVKDADAAIYFDSRDILQTIDRSGVVTEFDCSVYRENLSRCIVYLDDVHTRGTDLKFPLGWTGCVTLSGDITLDKTVQSCMRMRQLGNGHSICFWASQEADIRIRNMFNLEYDEKAVVKSEHVLKFISSNSQIFEKTNMSHWTIAAMNYTRKTIAHKLFETATDENAMKQLFDIIVDNEFVTLQDMYCDKDESLLTEIAWGKFQKIGTNFKQNRDVRCFVRDMQDKVFEKLNQQAPDVKQFSHALDEEQQKELEQEQEAEEERHAEHFIAMRPAKPHLDSRFQQLIRDGVVGDVIKQMTDHDLLLTIPKSLQNTQLSMLCLNDQDAWADHLFVSKDFNTVIEGSSTACDEFLRSVWWIAKVNDRNVDRKYVLIILSSHECDRLMSTFRSSTNSTLFTYRPRLNKLHNSLIHDTRLQVTGRAIPDELCVDDKVQIDVFAGSMYFDSDIEQNAFCGFLGLIPKHSRTQEEKEALENGILHGISKSKGFVPKPQRHLTNAISEYVGDCKFNDNPVDLVIKLIEVRHQSLHKESHVASILERGRKMNIDNGRVTIKIEPNDDEDDF